MSKFLAVVAFIGSAMILQTSSATAAAPLRQPTGKWVVDYGDTLCTAARAYGSPENPIRIAFRPSPNGNIVRLVIVRPGWVPDTVHVPIKTSITAEASTTALRFASNDRKSNIIWINFDRAALNGLSAANEIAIKGKGIDERFALPDMAAVLKSLDRCNEDLRAVWNVGLEPGGKLAKPATSLKPLVKLFSNDDYPDQALKEGASGATQVMLMIDESGKLKDCMVEQASGIATLDAVTCGLLSQRAKFVAAMDADGKPVRSVITTRIRWVMPD